MRVVLRAILGYFLFRNPRMGMIFVVLLAAIAGYGVNYMLFHKPSKSRVTQNTEQPGPFSRLMNTIQETPVLPPPVKAPTNAEVSAGTETAIQRVEDSGAVINKPKKSNYPAVMAKIMGPGDGKQVESALAAAYELGVGEQVRWSNKDNGHKGMAIKLGAEDGAGCAVFQVSNNRGNGFESAMVTRCSDGKLK